MTASDNTPLKREPPPKEARCPICGKPRDERYDPFCSKRCADIDLHRWLSGAYLVPGSESDEGSGADEK